MKPQRAKGVVVYRSDTKTNSNVQAAIAAAKKKEEERQERAAARALGPVPNYICYAWLFPNYDPKTGRGAPSPLPECKKCDGIIHPQEHHDCPGFTPKFKEHTKESHERWEAEREEIRETRRALRGVFCTECGELMEDPEDAQWHAEDHGGKAYRELYAVDGEPDGDMEGYEDEPEEDYCEGDDDGYDCD
jgi:hypothetical protein